jgi:hypothetical protein
MPISGIVLSGSRDDYLDAQSCLLARHGLHVDFRAPDGLGMKAKWYVNYSHLGIHKSAGLIEILKCACKAIETRTRLGTYS